MKTAASRTFRVVIANLHFSIHKLINFRFNFGSGQSISRKQKQIDKLEWRKYNTIFWETLDPGRQLSGGESAEHC